MIKIQGNGKFRKSKAYGLIAGLSLSVAFLTAGQTVSAAELTDAPSGIVSDLSELTPTSHEENKEVDETTTQQDEEDVVDVSVPQLNVSVATQDEAKEKIESEQDKLKDNVTVAEKEGVIVNVDKEVTKVELTEENKDEKTKEVVADLQQQNKKVDEAIAKQKENQLAYESAVADREQAVKQGQKDLVDSKAKLNEQVEEAKKLDLKVEEKTTSVKPDYVDITGLQGKELAVAMAKNIQLYEEAVKNGVALQDSSTAVIKSQIENYKKNNGQSGNMISTGIKWQSNTTVEVLENVTRMNGDEAVTSWPDPSIREAAKVAIQGLNYDQNTDAKFDYIFRIDDMNKYGSVIVRNTSNGDVKLVFDNYRGAKFTGKYFAIWGDNNGGIAWGVFGTATGSGTSNSGEAGSGGGGAVSGRQLGVVYGYNLYLETFNETGVATLNDVDNAQTINVGSKDIFNGSEVELGQNISRNGEVFTVGAGDVSQGSSSELGTNGIRWKFNDLRKVVLYFDHTTSLKTATSIVAGAFGATSDIPIEVEKPKLVAESVDVELPSQPSKPVNQKVDVKYYEVSTTPTPIKDVPKEDPKNEETPTPTPTPNTPVVQQSILPKTGDSSSPFIVGGLVLVSLSAIALIRYKKSEKE